MILLFFLCHTIFYIIINFIIAIIAILLHPHTIPPTHLTTHPREEGSSEERPWLILLLSYFLVVSSTDDLNKRKLLEKVLSSSSSSSFLLLFIIFHSVQAEIQHNFYYNLIDFFQGGWNILCERSLRETHV